jgi:hypothetical protein
MTIKAVAATANSPFSMLHPSMVSHLHQRVNGNRRMV